MDFLQTIASSPFFCFLLKIHHVWWNDCDVLGEMKEVELANSICPGLAQGKPPAAARSRRAPLGAARRQTQEVHLAQVLAGGRGKQL